MGGLILTESKAMIDVINPLNGEKIESVPKAGEKEAISAVDAAETAFHEWSELTAYERNTYLTKWHD